MKTENELHTLAKKWYNHAQQAHKAHYEAGIFYEKLFSLLGVPVIIPSAITGTASGLDLITDNRVVSLICLCIAVLSGLQTSLKCSQRAECHRVAGAKYGAVQRELEEFLAALNNMDENTNIKIGDIRKQLDMAIESPEIPVRFRKKYDK